LLAPGEPQGSHQKKVSKKKKSPVCLSVSRNQKKKRGNLIATHGSLLSVCLSVIIIITIINRGLSWLARAICSRSETKKKTETILIDLPGKGKESDAFIVYF